MPQRIGGFVPKASGGLLVALADGLYDFEPVSGAMNLRVPSPLPPHVKLHECHCDRQGRFWIGAYDHDFPANRAAKGASIFRLDGDRLTPVIEGIAVANGLAFSPDGRFLVVTERGTSFGYRDAWAMGFSRHYTVGVWAGRADGSTRPVTTVAAANAHATSTSVATAVP